MTLATTLAPTLPEAPAQPAVLEIVVSHEDIRDGVQGDSFHCAVAVALKRAGHRGVEVTSLSYVRASGVDYATSDELRRWINTFDSHQRMAKPERFVLRPGWAE